MSKSLNQTEAILAVGITNAFFTNLARMQQQGRDTNLKEIRKECLADVFDFYLFAQKEVLKQKV